MLSEVEYKRLMKQAESWSVTFLKNEHSESLTEQQKSDADAVINFFVDHMCTFYGLQPTEWNADAVADCCMHVMVEKVSAEQSFFESMAPVLLQFFAFLEAQKVLQESKWLCDKLKKIEPKIISNALNPANWGMAKSLVMSAKKEGFDVLSQESMNGAVAWYNLQRLRENKGEEIYEDAIEDMYKTIVGSNEFQNVGRNDLCPCGSGKKYKKCCLDKIEMEKAEISEMERMPFEFKELMIEKLLKKRPKTKKERETFMKELCKEWEARHRVPSAATMERCQRHNFEEMAKSTSAFVQSPEGKGFIEKTSAIKIERDPFVEKAKQSGNWKEALLEAENMKKSNGEKWAFEAQYEILFNEFPGFELWLNELFFKPKCKTCTRPDKETTGCEQGVAECLYNSEFEKFIHDRINSIIAQLKQGKQPELQIPERLIEIDKKFENLKNQIKK